MVVSEIKLCIKCLVRPQRAPRQSYCNECNREYGRQNYLLNKDRYKNLSKIHRDAVKNFINKEKDKPCADCGITYPYYVMDFDHLGEETKAFNLSSMKRRNMSIDLIKTEIAKCEVVCSNCHRMRTYERLTKKEKQ